MEAKLFIFAAVAISEVFSACKPTNTKFKNFQKHPKRSKPFAVELFTKRCTGLNEFYYYWKVEELTEEKKLMQESTLSSISIDGYDYDSETCFNISYLITVQVSHYPDLSNVDEISGDFRFQADFMHIQIVGGNQKGHRVGDDLVIDAETLSRDTSYPPDEDNFAGNIVTWESDPDLDFIKTFHGLILTVPKEYLTLENVYLFRINVTRTKIPNFIDTEFAVQSVVIVDRTVPHLQISCIKNCIWPLSKETTAFEVQCYQNCENLNYTWMVEPQPAKQIQLGNGYDTIIFAGESFRDGQEINVSFLVFDYIYSITLRFVSGLKTGMCSIFPDSGIGGITLFTITCTQFSSPFGLSRVLIFQHDRLDESDTVLIDEYSYREDTEVFLAPGIPTYVTIVVEDHAFLQTRLDLTLNIEDFSPSLDIAVMSRVKILVLSPDSTSVTSYSYEGYNNEVVQMVCSLLEALHRLKASEVVLRDMHKHMVLAIIRSKAVRFSTALQRILVLCKIQKYEALRDSVTSRLISEAILDNSLNAHFLHNHQQNTHIPHFIIQEILNYTMSLSSELLEENPVILRILKNEVLPHNYDSYDEIVSEKMQIRSDFRKILSNLVIALQTNCITTLFEVLPEEKSNRYIGSVIAVKTKRKDLHLLRDHYLDVNFKETSKSKVVLPPELLNTFVNQYRYIDYQFVVFRKNPFWWHTSAASLNTQVTLFDIFHNCDKVRTLNTPFYLHLEVNKIPRVVISDTLSDDSFAIYRVELKPNVTVAAEFLAVGEHPHDYWVTWSECVCTENDFASSRTNLINTKKNWTGRFLRVDNGEMQVMYICIKKRHPRLTYRFFLTTFACIIWNVRTTSWMKGGCKVVNPFLDKDKTMICECKHASLFSGEILAPETTRIINLKIDFSIEFVKNHVMVTVITGLLLLWGIFLILAHLRDKSMKKKNVVHKLDDNVPGDRNPYLVVVFTGIFYDAGTTADVSLRIVGNLSHSRTHVLKCEGVTLLKRNSQDWFMIYTPHPLGKLKKIQVWHNCKGSHPHWYCDRIIVQDIKMGAQYCFTVKKWFSLIWGKGKIFRDIPVSKARSPIALFRTQFEKDMKDKHMWLSIITRDFQSNFNSKERVSTGFCFLFFSMLINAMLLHSPHNSPSDSIDRPSSYDFDATFMIAFIGSWLAAIPVSFLIYFIFKNSAPL